MSVKGTQVKVKSSTHVLVVLIWYTQPKVTGSRPVQIVFGIKNRGWGLETWWHQLVYKDKVRNFETCSVHAKLTRKPEGYRFETCPGLFK